MNTAMKALQVQRNLTTIGVRTLVGVEQVAVRRRRPAAEVVGVPRRRRRRRAAGTPVDVLPGELRRAFGRAAARLGPAAIRPTLGRPRAVVRPRGALRLAVARPVPASGTAGGWQDDGEGRQENLRESASDRCSRLPVLL